MRDAVFVLPVCMRWAPAPDAGRCCSLFSKTRAAEYRALLLALWAWLLCDVHDKHCGGGTAAPGAPARAQGARRVSGARRAASGRAADACVHHAASGRVSKPPAAAAAEQRRGAARAGGGAGGQPQRRFLGCCGGDRRWQRAWKLTVAGGVPQQGDGGSCGAMVLAYADCAMHGWWPDQPLGVVPGREAALRLGILRTLQG